jgi:hypothetical protein
MVFDAATPIGAQEVETEAVFGRFILFKQPMAELGPLAGIDLAFEDAVLDALAKIEADFGDAAEAALAGVGDSGDIIGDQHKHHSPHFQIKGG